MIEKNKNTFVSVKKKGGGGGCFTRELFNILCMKKYKDMKKRLSTDIETFYMMLK